MAEAGFGESAQLNNVAATPVRVCAMLIQHFTGTTSELTEIALALVRLGRGARFIVNVT